MITKYSQRFFLPSLTALLMVGCIEPYDFEAKTYEEVLVLEATITDELKRQEVLLTKSFMVGKDTLMAQTGADVRITDDSGNQFLFEEVEAGRYESTAEFRAVSNRTYQLHIVTPQGQYESDATFLQESSGINNLYARRTTYNEDDGVALFVDNYNSLEASGYFRYKYEETYKIISPLSYDYDLVYENGEFLEIPKTKEETICYNTLASNDFILAGTTTLQENHLEGFLVRFIKTGNPISSRRYSILVKQYALSAEAYAYYESLKKLSGSDNIFSQNQPGFVTGNVYNVRDPEEKVVGMFNVSSFSSRRMYFNYEDFYEPQDTRPHFTDDCEVFRPSFDPATRIDDFIASLELGWVKYLGPSQVPAEDAGPYRVANASCVDCTILGTNEVPNFWVED